MSDGNRDGNGNPTWPWLQEQEELELSDGGGLGIPGVGSPRSPLDSFPHSAPRRMHELNAWQQVDVQQPVQQPARQPAQRRPLLAAHQFPGEVEQERGGAARTVQAPLPQIQGAKKKKAKTSKYKGVSFYKRINRWETHIWSNKGKQSYIGSCSSEEAGARLYDRAYIKYRGRDTPNFPYSDYEHEVPYWIDLDDDTFTKLMRDMSRGRSKLWFSPKYLEHGRRFWGPRWRPKASLYRGVYLMKPSKKWVATIRVDKKQIRLASTNTQELAARVYDRAALKFVGKEKAQLNFDLKDYEAEMPVWKDMDKAQFLRYVRQMVKDQANANREQEAVAAANANREPEAVAAAEEPAQEPEIMNWSEGDAPERVPSEEHNDQLQFAFPMHVDPAVRDDDQDDHRGAAGQDVLIAYEDLLHHIDLELRLGPPAGPPPHLHNFFR